MDRIYVATVQDRRGIYHDQIIDDPTMDDEGTVHLDHCPVGTHEVVSFATVAGAAKHLGISEAEVIRQITPTQEEIDEINARYEEAEEAARAYDAYEAACAKAAGY